MYTYPPPRNQILYRPRGIHYAGFLQDLRSGAGKFINRLTGREIPGPHTPWDPQGAEEIVFAPSQPTVEPKRFALANLANPFKKLNAKWLLLAAAVIFGGLVLGTSRKGKRMLRINPRRKKSSSQAPWWAATAIGAGLLMFPEPVTTVTGAGILATVAGAKLLT